MMGTVVRGLTAEGLIGGGGSAADRSPAGLRDDAVRACAPAFAPLQIVIKELGASARAAIHSPPATVGDHALPLPINDLTASSNPVVLVLDDNRLRNLGTELISVNRSCEDADAG